MASKRQTQVAEMIAHLASEFFAREAGRESLITVTRANISPDLCNATILFTVFPESGEGQAISFAKRNRPEFRDYVKKHARMKFLPHFDFEIDEGEKNRQELDRLS